MIQALINKVSHTSFSLTIGWYIDVADKLVGTPTFTTSTLGDDTYYAMTFPYFLYKLESHQTGKTKLFTRTGVSNAVGVNLNKYKRQVTFAFKYNTNPAATEDLSAGEVIVGTDEFPLGFYNITIYETETDGELNPDNAKSVVYNGLLNMRPVDTDTSSNFEEVQYKEYTTNDSENESVYLTN